MWNSDLLISCLMRTRFIRNANFSKRMYYCSMLTRNLEIELQLKSYLLSTLVWLCLNFINKGVIGQVLRP